jgi:multidrug efflux system membrane fusion protein
MVKDWPNAPEPPVPAPVENHAGRAPAQGAMVPAEASGPPPATNEQPGGLVVAARPRGRSRLRLVLWSVLVLAAAAAAAWFLIPPTVAVVTPTRGPAVEAVYATGTVEAATMVPIAGRVTSTLASVEADEGDHVAEGQLLARFDDRDLQAVLRQLQAQEAYAQQEYERNQRLQQTGAVSESTFDRAYSEWLAAKAATARAAAEASYMELRAPIDGTIVKREGEVGELIPANQAIFWLTRDAALRIATEVDEEDIARVAVGQDVLIRADAFEGSIFAGRVQSITPMGDPVARTYRVRIALVGETPLLIGMTAETNIVIRRDEDALLLPSGAVDAGRVWRVVDGRLEARPVSVGVQGGGRVEILSGVAMEDRIVAAPDASLEPGLRVRAEPADSQ